MKQLFKLILAGLTCLVLFGCAHPISMNPNLDKIQSQSAVRIDKQVGFYISDASKALEVTTAGGGGDKVRYFPYRDIETGFYKALAEVFQGVSKVKEPQMTDDMRKSGITLLIVPEIKTSSSSPSPFTWPPTQFTVTLVCTVMDSAGRLVRKLSVTGEGKAEFDEFKANFSLSAVRATNDALSKLITALAQAPEFRGGAVKNAATPAILVTSSGTTRADLNGNWSGKYTCGPYLGTGQVSSPLGFVNNVSMEVADSGATLSRKGSSFSETVSGQVTDEFTASLQGQGALVSAPDKPWTTRFAGRFSVANGLLKFGANGQQVTSRGAVARECTVELTKATL
jgi:hypothetical protein